MVKRLLLTGALAVFAFCSVAEPTAQTPVYTTGTGLVVLHVNVQDRRGGFVTDLPSDAFHVFEDGHPERVSLFLRDDSPVTAGLIIDNSISMYPLRSQVIEAATAFARSAKPHDQLFGLVFNENVRAVLDPDAPFTNDAAVLRAALDRAIVTRGRTALFDALIDGLAYAQRSPHQRQALILVGDGGDNESRHSFGDVQRQAQMSNVVIYSVTIADPLDGEANPERLERLAESTGGRAVEPGPRLSVRDALQQIGVEMRQTYTLGYSPSRPPDGTFRRIAVTVTPPAGSRVIARTRTGYLATAASSVAEESSHGP